MTPQPIRVFWSPLTRRFYASRAYKSEGDGTEFVTITGEKFDVTDDIARIIVREQVEFAPKKTAKG